MAHNVLIMGESGTGKSFSIRNLAPSETYIINVLDKPLPFKNSRKNYVSKAGGNYFSTDNAKEIIKIVNGISATRPDIKNIIVDDFQYVMANQFMRRASEKGFEKFNEIGQSGWQVIHECTKAREDLHIYTLSHTSTDESSGKIKCKTIGKMVDNTICLEGMFTLVLHAQIIDGEYKFLTQNDGTHLAKSPPGMFDSKYIDNNVQFISEKMKEYFWNDCDDTNAETQAIEKAPAFDIKNYINTITTAQNTVSLKEVYQEAAGIEWNDNGRSLKLLRKYTNERKGQLEQLQT